jgi:hypothetical protein
MVSLRGRVVVVSFHRVGQPSLNGLAFIGWILWIWTLDVPTVSEVRSLGLDIGFGRCFQMRTWIQVDFGYWFCFYAGTKMQPCRPLKNRTTYSLRIETNTGKL